MNTIFKHIININLLIAIIFLTSSCDILSSEGFKNEGSKKRDPFKFTVQTNIPNINTNVKILVAINSGNNEYPIEEKNGKQYNNIASIMALPKGSKVEELENTYHFDIEDEATYMNWEKIPNWIQERIKKSDNFVGSDLEKFVLEYENNVKEVNTDGEFETSDDLPF